MVWVNGEREHACLLTFLQTKRVNVVVLVVRERPYILVDFLTLCRSNDGSGKTPPCAHVCSTHSDVHPSLTVSHPTRLTLSHANMHTHSRGCLGGMRDPELCWRWRRRDLAACLYPVSVLSLPPIFFVCA